VLVRTIPYPALVVGVPDRRTHNTELVPMSSRPLAALASIVLAVLGFVFLLPPDCAYACSCAMPPGSQKERAEQALSDSDAVFSGEVVEIDKSPPPDKEVRFNPDYGKPVIVTLRVSDVWKGPEQETLEVNTRIFGAGCGYPFKEGQEYLVYAPEGKRGLTVGLCSETKELSKAGADLALLGNSSEKPKDAGDEALSDTSGGVSARAMVGMAGLLMAASLLVVARLVRTG
jgi:hypothetical protein